MRDNTDNDARWDEAVVALAGRLGMYVWHARLSLYWHDAYAYYSRLEETEKNAFLEVLGWVGNTAREVPMNLSLEQFWQITDVWRQFREKYQMSVSPEVSMFFFLDSVMAAPGVSTDHKRNLCGAMLKATMIYRELFGQEAAGALEYVVLQPVTGNWELRPVLDNFQCDLVISQLQNHCGYCKRVSRLMQAKFKTAFILSPTGGDFHNQGRTPLFVTCGGSEYVLKPRNMLEEQCIDKMVGLFNRIMPGLELPVSQGIELIDAGGGERFALVKKYVRQKEMTQNQALVYYKKLGALLLMIKLFGIEDIHMENMMTTEAGPVIIDGECLFYYNYLHEEDMKTQALGYLIDGFNEEQNVPGLSNNVCLRLNSNKQCAAVSIKGQLTDYGEAVVQGFQEMAAEIRKANEEDDFAAEAYEIYREMVIDPELRIRSVPVNTSEWKTVFYVKEKTLKEKCPELRNLVINGLPHAFRNVVGTDRRNYQWVKGKNIDKLIIQSIGRGDVPFFYLKNVKSKESPQNKLALVLEGTDICTINLDRVSNEIKQVFKANLNWLLSDEAVQSLQALLAK